MLKRFLTLIITILMFCLCVVSVSAADIEAKKDVYHIDATLSCYINAMGGVEFGKPLLQSASVKMTDGDNGMLTLSLGKSQVEIYSVVCDTFIDVAPSVQGENTSIPNGTLGYYTESGELNTENLSYTLSTDTAKNARDEDVHYVDSITFPVNKETETYYLTLYVNSNVMGTQFSKETYPAVLTVDWSSISSEATSSPEDEDTDDKTDSSKETLQPDSMGGLNIYHADDENEASTESISEQDRYTVYLKKPLFIATLSIAALLVVSGIIVVLVGRKDGRNEK